MNLQYVSGYLVGVGSSAVGTAVFYNSVVVGGCGIAVTIAGLVLGFVADAKKAKRQAA